jgi:hypothetical protein
MMILMLSYFFFDADFAATPFSRFCRHAIIFA